MSGQLLTWAIDICEQRDYPQHVRMMLVVLVQMARNGSGESHGGKDCLRKRTGGSLRGNFNAMQRLVDDGLVERERRGKSWLYRVVSPVLKANGADHTSAPDADHTSAPDAGMVVSSASLADLKALSSAVDADKASQMAAVGADNENDIGTTCTEHRHLVQKTSAPDADRTYLRGTEESELSARATRDAAAAPDGRSGAALPAVPPKAPLLGGTTSGGGLPANALRPLRPAGAIKPTDPFDDGATLRRTPVKPLFAAPELLQAARRELMERAAARGWSP
jgi:hypothetical protein